VQASRHRLEGRSILPLLRGGAPTAWRDSVFSEIDYAFYQARDILDAGPSDARGYMVRTDRWKYIYFKGYRPQLFDLQNDPDEFVDLGDRPGMEAVLSELQGRLFDRLLARRNRITMTDEQVLSRRKNEGSSGIIIGRW
jgi:arylsulfatase A-like enzyme